MIAFCSKDSAALVEGLVGARFDVHVLDVDIEGAVVVHSLEDAIQACSNDDEAFLIGGAELYQEGFKRANKLYLTEIDAEYEGDAHFPAFNQSEWRLIAQEAHLSANGLAFSYKTYERV